MLTFFFFLSVTLTPSTDTSIVTFFFLMPFALNSYWKREKIKEVERGGMFYGQLTRILRIAATISTLLVGLGTSNMPIYWNKDSAVVNV